MKYEWNEEIWQRACEYYYENNLAKKLTKEKALAVFKSQLEPKEIAVKYGISTALVYQIKSGRAWKKIEYLK